MSVTPRRKVRLQDLRTAKDQGKKFAAVTCYDATSARLLERSNIDVVLVGDSLGHVIQGQSSTLGVSPQDVVYHTRCVASVLHTPLLVTDMPFGLAGLDRQTLVRTARAAMAAGAQGVKIEGAGRHVCRDIERLILHGVPVMGHLGFTPQSVHALGGYRIQGKSAAQASQLVQEASALEQAGCFAIVLELVTPQVATQITKSVKIPTIGIGAGPGCDGQILVWQDLLGMNLDFAPKFVKHFAQLESVIGDALETYCREVAGGTFPPSASGSEGEPRHES